MSALGGGDGDRDGDKVEKLMEDLEWVKVLKIMEMVGGVE